jgi:hypothetical protein
MRELASSVYKTNTNVEFLFGCQLYQTETGPEVNKSMSE